MKKTPSSLDYESLLHELALKNWRRAILSRDFSRALTHADTLARSRDRFWRWQGLLDLAVTHLCTGNSTESLLQLAAAKRVFSDLPSFALPALETEAHLWLDARSSPEAALVPAELSLESELLLHHRGRALARLRREREAFDAADAISRRGGRWASLLTSHVRAEVQLARGQSADAVDTMRAGLDTVSEAERRLGATPSALVLYTLAGELAAGNPEEALALLEEIVGLSDGVLHWPVPHVRSHYDRGALLRSSGDSAGARSSFETFLGFWAAGDLDRVRVEDALQFVNA